MVVNEFEVWIPRVGVLNGNEIPDYARLQERKIKWLSANCGVLGHNTKTCHRHLPPKEKKTINQKRKLNSGEGSSSQTQKKMSAMRATRALGTKSAPTSSRPQQPTSTPTSMKGATPTRSSQRIIQNSKAVGK